MKEKILYQGFRRYKYSRILFILVIIILLGRYYSLYSRSTTVTIVASGETHGLIYPCDCIDEPAGGMAKRMTIISRLRERGNILLLDAGGFCGGGLYDFYTEGIVRDSLRSVAAIQAMAQIQYDAVGLGDEELQYNTEQLVTLAKKEGLPLVSANCFYRNGKSVVSPYIIVKKGHTTFGITAVTTQEKLLLLDDSVIVKDPIATLKKVWPKVCAKSDQQIIISHLGEEKIEQLVKAFPECDILVNGHRKMSVQPVTKIDEHLIMQFGFQGKKLSHCTYDVKKKSYHPIPQEWLLIHDTIPEDTAIIQLLDAIDFKRYKKSTVLDLYLMSQCPYGIPALKEVLDYYESFSLIDLNLWFVGDVINDDSLRSLHGQQEVDEEQLWLAVKSLYPEMWESFLYLRANQDISADKAVAQLNLDTAQLQSWITNYGKEKLAHSYRRSQRLQIESSPELFINNYPYTGPVTFFRLAKGYCDEISNERKPKACDSIPECFEDSDCKKKGHVGICIYETDYGSGGVCTYKKGVQFPFVVVVPDSSIVQTETASINTTGNLFPAAQIERYSYSSKRGKELVSLIKPDHLPLYLFGEAVTGSLQFKMIASGIEKRGEWFTFKEGIMKKHFYHRREKKSGRITLFIDPLFPDVAGVVSLLLESYPKLNNVDILPHVPPQMDTTHIQEEEKVRIEEALRWLVIQREYGNNTFITYVSSYSFTQDQSYWQPLIKKIGISLHEFNKANAKGKSLLPAHRNLIDDLGILGPVELLVNNQEVIPIKNKGYLESILQKLK